MQAFRQRSPDDALGGPQVMAACTQAAALLDTYRTLRRAYLNFYGEQDSDAGMSEDSAAWMSGRFSLMLEEDPAVGKDRELQKCLKWCIDSTLILQQMLSQRPITEIHESSVSPGNALNNLLDVSESGCDSFSSRTTQYLLARCRDESKERLAQIHIWAALSIALSEYFFKEQLTCAVRAQGNSEKALSLVRAALSLSWERTSLPQILKPHFLLLQAVKSIEDSRLLIDPDKERIAKNCGNIGPPHMKEFSPLFGEPKTYEEVLISMYTLPLSHGNDSGSGGDSNVNRQQRSEPGERDSSNVHGDPTSEAPKEGTSYHAQILTEKVSVVTLECLLVLSVRRKGPECPTVSRNTFLQCAPAWLSACEQARATLLADSFSVFQDKHMPHSRRQTPTPVARHRHLRRAYTERVNLNRQ
ncbi:hypothetical protein, conserved [Eimeria tenella]|uniref:Uncharacterized protein n=1 Tax=Eimeria tenella TaxID=5802 RepID=U6KV77_EIMTE|nr:hypothetical protein, conserved [Eimeria tenella]CDJ42017.1 hypothetical protein, conserved [Eimeria tenella]|eukprot:XP_013232767.1 hypothetical protein, conserved [Eimeria tenella]